MIQNHFKIAFRNLLRNKFSSLINIAGLAIGLTCVILISLFIKDELSYDRFFKDADRIYRVNVDGKMGENEFYAGYTPPPAGEALVDEYPEVEDFTRIYRPGMEVLEYRSGDDKRMFNESNIFAVDANFLEILTYPLAKGNPETCLSQPNSIVVTPQIAKKYFGDEDPMGKTILYGSDKKELQVTGVLEDMTDLPASVKFDVLVPVENFGVVKYFHWSWVWLNMATYLKVNEEAANQPGLVARLESRFQELIKARATGAFKRIGQPYEEFLEKGNRWDLHLQPLTDIHLYSGEIESSISEQNDIQNLYIFGIIAVFIILLACVNFMNLSTAQSVKRSKEIGIRKVLGSGRSVLIRQFLTESALFTIISIVLAVVLSWLLLPFFNQFSGKSISSQAMLDPHILLLIIGLGIFTTIISGFYPAVYLTSFKPVNVLKGGTTKNPKGRFIRNELVVFQFTIAIALIISTIVVYMQLEYTNNRNLGYDKENLIILNNTEKLRTSEETLRQELATLPEVSSATISTSMFTKSSFGDFYVPEAVDPSENIAKDISLNSFMVDDQFVETLNLEVIKGRGFSEKHNDSLSVLINETSARQIGWENPIGRSIRYPGGQQESYEVVGVLKDFHVESLHSAIGPFALFSTASKSYKTGTSFITLKINSDNPQRLLETIESKWETFQPEVPFEFSFLDENLQTAYLADKRLADLFTIFSGLSIFIACLGLLGLVAFTAQQRTREIGVRKVVGAKTLNIVRLLSADFLKLVLIAMLIASPIAWYAMSRWLQDFPYRVEISWWMFLAAGSFALLIALATVSFQAIKAATANPVKSLRTE